MAFERIIVTRRLSFDVVIEVTGGKELPFTVHDDGWKIWVKTPSGNVFDTLNFGTDSERGPDFASAIELVTAWAERRWQE